MVNQLPDFQEKAETLAKSFNNFNKISEKKILDFLNQTVQDFITKYPKALYKVKPYFFLGNFFISIEKITQIFDY